MSRFSLLRFPLVPFVSIPRAPHLVRSPQLADHLAKADFSVRLLRYWWAGAALAAESRRQGRPLVVVDLGCERGWLKHFTPDGVVGRWIGLDWSPKPEATELSRYDQVIAANFDEPLPVDAGTADAVVSLHVFEHLPRPGATMAEVARLLRPGGIFLGCAPTMPDWLARPRERYFRRRLRAGRIAPGGHITVLSPDRWKSLAENAGLEVDFLTGSHLARMTGSRVENWRWWIRLNQLWGALFPALGSECCVQARRADTRRECVPLSPQDGHWRRAWLALGGTIAATALAGSVALGMNLQEARCDRVANWIAAHQDGDEVFIVPGRYECVGERFGRSVFYAEDLSRTLALAKLHPDAHVLVTLDEAVSLLRTQPDRWMIDSRFEQYGADYLLLRQSDRRRGGTPLGEYLALAR